MSLLKHYQKQVDSGVLRHDPAQAAAINVLQGVLDELSSPKAPVPSKGFSFFGRSKKVVVPAAKGAYLWGGVGRGKTWLMDCFFEAVPIVEKRRYHYHHFMLMMHEELRKLGHGHKEPLAQVAKNLSADVELLCIDEFHVMDIGDAMILAGILQGLFDNGVTLVTTSNRVPGDLYKNGLQRDRFKPAIELLNEHTHVMELDNGMDYRMLKMEEQAASAAFIRQNEQVLEQHFREMAQGVVQADTSIIVNHRKIPVRKMTDDVIWFDFDAVCKGPRATHDYIHLADQFKTVLISNVPVMNHESENPARRFLNLIDELYDRKVRLFISTETELDALYQGDDLQFEFARAVSRLNEMQTPGYQVLH